MTNSANRFLFSLAFLTTLSPTTWALEIPEPQPVDGRIDWVYDYEEGKMLSRESGKPMFVVFRCER